MIGFTVGLDLGPPGEPTGLAVVEHHVRRDGAHFAVRHLERLLPGTPFAAITDAVETAIRGGPAGALGHCPIVCDITATGTSVLPHLRASIRSGWLVPVVLTSGMQASQSDGVWHLPKRDLVVALQVMLQDRRLKVASELPEADTLVRELAAFRPKVTLAKDGAAAADWRDRPGDDLVLAVALAVWWANRSRPLSIGVPDAMLGGLNEMFDRAFPGWRTEAFTLDA